MKQIKVGVQASMLKEPFGKIGVYETLKKIGELGQGYDNDTIFICQADCPDDAQRLASLAKEKYGVKNVFIGNLGAVIGSHAGPGTLSIFFLGSEK